MDLTNFHFFSFYTVSFGLYLWRNKTYLKSIVFWSLSWNHIVFSIVYNQSDHIFGRKSIAQKLSIELVIYLLFYDLFYRKDYLFCRQVLFQLVWVHLERHFYTITPYIVFLNKAICSLKFVHSKFFTENLNDAGCDYYSHNQVYFWKENLAHTLFISLWILSPSFPLFNLSLI